MEWIKRINSNMQGIGMYGTDWISASRRKVNVQKERCDVRNGVMKGTSDRDNKCKEGSLVERVAKR